MSWDPSQRHRMAASEDEEPTLDQEQDWLRTVLGTPSVGSTNPYYLEQQPQNPYSGDHFNQRDYQQQPPEYDGLGSIDPQLINRYPPGPVNDPWYVPLPLTAVAPTDTYIAPQLPDPRTSQPRPENSGITQQRDYTDQVHAPVDGARRNFIPPSEPIYPPHNLTHVQPTQPSYHETRRHSTHGAYLPQVPSGFSNQPLNLTDQTLYAPPMHIPGAQIPVPAGLSEYNAYPNHSLFIPNPYLPNLPSGVARENLYPQGDFPPEIPPPELDRSNSLHPFADYLGSDVYSPLNTEELEDSEGETNPGLGVQDDDDDLPRRTPRPRANEPKRKKSEDNICWDCKREPVTELGRLQRCTPCHREFQLNGTPNIRFKPNVDLLVAFKRIYPAFMPGWVRVENDDVQEYVLRQDIWIPRLLQAILTCVNIENDVNTQDHPMYFSNQQDTFNSTARLHPRDKFGRLNVNARVRLLWQCIRCYHEKIPPPYPLGGDNHGHTPVWKYKFSERLKLVLDILSFEKRVSLGVIEGKSVLAFVGTPKSFAKRKVDNKKSNERKDHVLQRGKRNRSPEEEEEAGPATKRRRRASTDSETSALTQEAEEFDPNRASDQEYESDPDFCP